MSFGFPRLPEFAPPPPELSPPPPFVPAVPPPPAPSPTPPPHAGAGPRFFWRHPPPPPGPSCHRRGSCPRGQGQIQAPQNRGGKKSLVAPPPPTIPIPPSLPASRYRGSARWETGCSTLPSPVPGSRIPWGAARPGAATGRVNPAAIRGPPPLADPDGSGETAGGGGGGALQTGVGGKLALDSESEKRNKAPEREKGKKRGGTKKKKKKKRCKTQPSPGIRPRTPRRGGAGSPAGAHGLSLRAPRSAEFWEG